jgi:hypothetical protein
VNDKQTAQDALSQLSPEGVKLAKRVMELERENLHIRSSTTVVTEIVAVVKGLIK